MSEVSFFIINYHVFFTNNILKVVKGLPLSRNSIVYLHGVCLFLKKKKGRCVYLQ